MSDEESESPEVSRPYKWKNPKPGDFTIGGAIDPPIDTPGAGYTVPTEIVAMAHELRRKIKDSPVSVPQRWYVWLYEYEQNHPRGQRGAVRMSHRRENHTSEEESYEVTNEGVERAKGNKLHKVLTPLSSMLPSLTKELRESQASGARMATEIRQSIINEKRADTEYMKTAFESVVAALNSVSALATNAYDSRKEDMEDRMELLRLLRDAQGEVPQGSALWGRIGALGLKLAQVMAPMAKAQGIDLSPLFPAQLEETTELAETPVAKTRGKK